MRCTLSARTYAPVCIAQIAPTADTSNRSPVPLQDKLHRVVEADAAADLVEAFNANVDKLNARMFTFMDYAVVGVNA